MNTEHILHPPSVVVVLLLGVLGALAPEIYRLYRLRGRLHRMKFSRSYFVISFLYALMGGLVAWILPSVTMWAAFYAGITWPVLISAALHRRPRRGGSVEFANEQSDVPLRASHVEPRFSLREAIRDHADGLF